MKLTATIENVYADGSTIVNTVTVDVPPLAAGDAYDWSEDHLFPLTGTGREDGDAAYFLTITECEDPGLVGSTFEWGL